MSGASDRWERVEALFAEAVARPPEEWGPFLHRACGSDGALRAEVEALLREHDADPDFLEGPPPWLAGREPDETGSGGGPTASADPEPPERVGPYRILGTLGRGGMGTVYLAEHRARDFTRRVALKVVRRGLDTDDVLARFRAERQILATLTHPNIAGLLDVGATGDGLPYLVMEPVEGRPLDRYCREEGLDLEARLRLVQTVGSAVHHAHQRLVVHRDLKPGNILVTDDGTPKLLDFGIAKLLDGGSADGTNAGTAPALTRAGQRLLTPEYAAPEQLRGEAVSTATDVWALGVLLYELLTGVHPSRAPGAADGASPGDPGRWDRDPPPPSVAVRRLREAGKRPPVARIAGELDTVVLAAMRRDPAERYASVLALSEDLRRYLSGLPVRARPATAAYRARKFVRRNPVLVGVGAALAVVLVAATAVTLHQSRRIQEEAARVARERDKALRVRGFLLEMFGATGAEGNAGDTVTARGLLDRRAATLDDELAHDPEMRAELMTVLAEGYERLGLWDAAEPLAREALELRRSELGPDHPDVAASLNVLGWLRHEQGRLDEAEVLLRESVERGRAALGGTGGGDVRLARALNDLGVVREARGDYAEAAALYRESLEMRRRIEGDEATGVAVTASNLSVVLYRQGEMEAAVEAAREALDLFQRAFGPDHRRTTIVQSNLAAMRSARGDHAGAEREHREILERRIRLHGERHPQVAFSLTMLANEVVAQDRPDEAEPLLRRALAIQEATLGSEHPNVAATHRVLGDVLAGLGRHPEALEHLEAGLALTRRVLGPGHEDVAILLGRQARSWEASGEGARAEAALREALRLSEATRGRDHLGTADLALALAGVLARQAAGAAAAPEAADVASVAEVKALVERVERALEAAGASPEHPVARGLAALRTEAAVLR